MADRIEAILRRPRVEDASGYSRSTLYLRISQGLWTRPVSLGPRAVGWPGGEVAALNASRIAGKTDEEIRALVTRLEKARTATPHIAASQGISGQASQCSEGGSVDTDAPR